MTNKEKIELNDEDYYQIKSFATSLNSIADLNQCPYFRAVDRHSTKKKTQYVFVSPNHRTPKAPSDTTSARRLTRSMRRNQTPKQIKKPSPTPAPTPSPATNPSPTPTPTPNPSPTVVPTQITPMQLDFAIPIQYVFPVPSPSQHTPTEENDSSQSMKATATTQASSKFNSPMALSFFSWQRQSKEDNKRVIRYRRL